MQSSSPYGFRPGVTAPRVWAVAFAVGVGCVLASLVVLLTVVRHPGRGVSGTTDGADGVGLAEQPAAGEASRATVPAVSSTTRVARRRPTATARSQPTAEAVLPTGKPRVIVEDAVLRRAIEEALGDDLPDTSVTVLRLKDGHGTSVDGDRVYYAASTFKLAVLYEAERRRSLGELDLDEVIYYSEDELAEDLGTIGWVTFNEDGGIRLRDALEAMVIYSDNASAVAILHRLGGDAVDATLAGLGLTQTSLSTYELPTTSNDMALLMTAIYEGRGVSVAARDEMRRFLLGQQTRDVVPAVVPEGVSVGNKTGTWDGSTHDVAFVEAPGGVYIIAVLSDQGWDWEPIQRVSAAVFATFAPTPAP